MKQSLSDDPNYEVVLALYDHQCPHCGSEAVTVHEIIPKSKNPRHWMDVDNRIPLCLSYHEYVHLLGTRVSEPKLRKLQQQWLDTHHMDIV